MSATDSGPPQPVCTTCGHTSPHTCRRGECCTGCGCDAPVWKPSAPLVSHPLPNVTVHYRSPVHVASCEHPHDDCYCGVYWNETKAKLPCPSGYWCPSPVVVFVGAPNNGAWCKDCADWVTRGQACPHFAVSTQTPGQFAADKGVAPPRGVFCERHYSWLCQQGQGSCATGKYAPPTDSARTEPPAGRP